MVVAGPLALSGGTALSEGLTTVGVFLFACLPLLAAWLVLDAPG